MCGTMNEKENTLLIGGRYYCKSCAEEKNKQKEKNISDWDELFNYIHELYGEGYPNGMMFKQLKDYREDPYNYTNKGIFLTLKYYYDLLDNEVIEGTGLGIIPYYYDKAKYHFIEIMNVERHMENFELMEETRGIVIQPPKDSVDLKSKRVLSFDNIEWEDVDE